MLNANFIQVDTRHVSMTGHVLIAPSTGISLLLNSFLCGLKVIILDRPFIHAFSFMADSGQEARWILNGSQQCILGSWEPIWTQNGHLCPTSNDLDEHLKLWRSVVFLFLHYARFCATEPLAVKRDQNQNQS